MCETPIFSPVFHSASTSFIISQAGEWEVKSISFSYTPLFGTINIQIIAQIVLICYSVGQAAMRRVLDDRPGPGQQEAIRGILGAKRIQQRGADISIHWIPGHAGIAGNEIADQWAGDAAARELRFRSRVPSGVTRPPPVDSAVSRSFMKDMLRRRAVDSWRESIVRGGSGRRPYRISREGTVQDTCDTWQSEKELGFTFFPACVWTCHDCSLFKRQVQVGGL